MKELASKELVQIVFEDLQYLIDEWPEGDIKDAEIRRASTVLRRLLHYKDIIKVWVTIVGYREYILNGDFIEILSHQRIGEVDFATSCNARNPGMEIYSVKVFNKIQTGNPPIRIRDGKNIPLKKFLYQPAIILNGKIINRDDLIKFVANKMGGAHYDNKFTSPSEASLKSMEEYFVGDRPALIHSMLSCGQAVASSASSQLLYETIQKKG